jgi:hypothetical protein
MQSRKRVGLLALEAGLYALSGCGSGSGAPALARGDGGGSATMHVDAASDGGPSSDSGSSDEPDAVANSDASPGEDATLAAGDASDASQNSEAGAHDAGPGDAGDAGAAPYKGVANSACKDLLTLKTTWYYNWELSPPCPAPQFVPMVWGHGNEQTQAGISTEVASAVSRGFKFVLGFNEPDNATQSNISVTTAVALWPAFNNPSVQVGSPATQANTAGQAWFSSFMKDVNADSTEKLRVDFIAAHWYGWNAGIL